MYYTVTGIDVQKEEVVIFSLSHTHTNYSEAAVQNIMRTKFEMMMIDVLWPLLCTR